MTGMKGRFLRKLKLIPTINSLKQGPVLHPNPTDIFCTQKSPAPQIYDDQDHKSNNPAELDAGLTGGRDEIYFLEEEMELEFCISNKAKQKLTSAVNSEEIRELAEENLVTPNLSDAKMEDNVTQEVVEKENYPCLADFKEICPPGEIRSVILYTTSLRGIRKTFQDCNTIRFLLKSLKVLFLERDVSLHLEYRDELWRTLGGKVVPPKLFINGRYIGGADEVVGLHEMGWLKKLLEGMPIDFTDHPCNGCNNMRFAICSNCSGSRKIFCSNGGKDELCASRCCECNENGLVKCPICC